MRIPIYRLFTLSAIVLTAAGAGQLTPTLPAFALGAASPAVTVSPAATASPAPRVQASQARVAASPQPAMIRDEHVTPLPPITGRRLAQASAMPANRAHSELTQAVRSRLQPMRPMQAMQATSSSNGQFLTRPYLTWHDITSIFDHCNPDYSKDGRVCEFDGSVGLSSNGVDPSFSLGYAQTRGGSDYLYYDGHNGWDYSMYYENVLSAAPGTVTLAGIDSVNTCFGQNVVIDHGNGFSTRYAHLSQIYVSVGQVVDRAQIIGQSGNTGCSSGPHLHFGVYINNGWTAVDPWGWAGAAGADPWPSDQGSLWLTGAAQFPVPTAPSAVQAVAGNASATVSWAPSSFDGGRSIVYYGVTATPGGANVTVPGTATSAVVTGLSNGGSYTFTVTALNGVGAATSSPSNSVSPSAWIGQYRALTPSRILDTRTGIGGFASPLSGGQTIDLPVVGRGGVPASGVAGVVLNVTVTGARGPGFLTVFPSGSPRPQSSSLDYDSGGTVANLVQVPVGVGGNASITVGGASTHAIVDVDGYYTTDTSTGNGLFHALTPARIADSRTGLSLSQPLLAGQSVDLQIAGMAGIPATGVAGVVFNLTATQPSAAGWLAVAPSGAAISGTSNLNFNAGQTVANRVVVGVGNAGRVTIRSGGGSVQVLVDVEGWFADSGAAPSPSGRWVGLAPARLLDTRNGTGGLPTLGPGAVSLGIAGLAGVPAQVQAVILNLTATNGSAPADFLSLYPSGASFSNTSDLNFVGGETRANSAVSRLGPDGRVTLYNALGRVDAIIDVDGYYS